MKLEMVLTKAWFGWGFYSQKFDKNQFFQHLRLPKKGIKTEYYHIWKGNTVIHFTGSDDQVKFLKISRLKHSIILKTSFFID